MTAMRMLVVFFGLAACSAPDSHHTGVVAPRPAPGTRLVVLLVIDQLPEWAFAQKRPALTGGGFDRLLAEGDWHVGQHPSAATLTSPGHALLGTGEASANSGILANEWWHRELGRRLRSVEDEDGKPTTKWLRVPGLGDALAAGHGGKAIAVSLKDRAAILPLGHAGTPIWYDHKTALWQSFAAVPWLDDWNRTHPVSAHLQDVWTPLDPARLAQLSGTVDDQPGETGQLGFGPTFPHAAASTKDPADAIFAMPLGNDLVLDTAIAAIDGEQLGSRDTPDLLVVSLSALDYVGHGWGHESWEAWDMALRLDQRIGHFLDELDHKVGAGRWAMIVTSDHGASPLPERMPRGGRLHFEAVKDAANHAAITELGAGEWIADAKYPFVYLTPAALAQPKKDLDVALKKISFALRSFPGIARVERTAAFAGHCEQRTGDARALCNTIDPERAGELIWVPAAGWIHEDDNEPVATAHGSLNAYDRLVPVIVLAPGRRAHAPLAAPDTNLFDMTKIAGMLAGWLGVTAPSALPR